MFSKILIANRGEIACRIIRTAKQYNIKTVAVYSDADKNALHTRLADEAVYIGPAPALQSYLNQSAILLAAESTGAQAIHPGYGFLSENPLFAGACHEKGIIFIGPSSDAMEKMADKGNAKEIMEKAGVPVIPGGTHPSRDVQDLKKQAEKLGFPVLLKACAGGGGKGMRAVHNSQEFEDICLSAQREAVKSFNDDKMIVEKFFPKAKHIEVQIFGDQHGNCVHLFERDCSVQRRYQKIVEEAPALNLSTSTREKLGSAAISAGKAIGYTGAGTIEFLVAPDEQFYFMEMNTRLQVEHPITECITGIDLVAWQFLVASGQALPLKQEDITYNGHAIEVRLYAEDPDNDFLPAIGKLRVLQWPHVDALRVDTGVVQGDEISVYYDPMIAKIIVWEESRARALAKLKQVLEEVKILGLTTNLSFLKSILHSSLVEKGEQYTTFLQETEISNNKQPLTDEEVIALVSATYNYKLEKNKKSDNPWTFNTAWRMNLTSTYTVDFNYNEKTYTVTFFKKAEYGCEISLNENIFLNVNAQASNGTVPEALDVEIDDQKYTILVQQQGAYFYLAYNDQQKIITLPQLLSGTSHALQQGTSGLRSPMPGTVIAVNVKQGDSVRAGEVLLIVEAMKMEHTVRAPVDGIVKLIYCQIGDTVSEGKELVSFEE